MPDLASRRLARTSCVLLPMDETMPIPVTTTRRIVVLPFKTHRGLLLIRPQIGRLRHFRKAPRAGSSPARLQSLVLLEQADLQIAGAVNDSAVRREPTVGNTQHQLRSHDTLDIDTVDHLLDGRQHLARKFQFAQAERPALARCAKPSKKKSDHLPQRIETKASRHHRITLEVAKEKPEVRLYVEFGADHPFAMCAAFFTDFG